MSCCDLEKVDAKDLHVVNLITLIYKAQKIYFNKMLCELEINNTQLHILFEIQKDSKINQEKIARRCNVNKGAIARSIKKLEDNGFIERTIDENNRRQNIISLMDKGNNTLNHSKMILNEFEEYLFDDNDYNEVLQIMLKELAIKVMSLNENGFDIE